MLQNLPFVLLSNEASDRKFISTEEWDAARTRITQVPLISPILIPVRLTINARLEVVRVERLANPIQPNQVGKNWVFKRNCLTLDVNMIPVVSGDVFPQHGVAHRDAVGFRLLPYKTPEEGLAGFAHEHYRIRQLDFPFAEGSQASRAYKVGRQALVEIDPRTQTVIKATVVKIADEGNYRFGTILSTTEKGHVVAVGRMANGGCAFHVFIA